MSDLMISLLILAGVVGVALLAALVDYTVSNPKTQPKISSTQFDIERELANYQILAILVRYAEKNPSQRFGQILRNTGLLQDVGVRDSSKADWETPDYYIDRLIIHEEPQVILERMKKELEQQK